MEMAGEKRSQDQDEVSFARTVLVDIEGTTTSISFVKVKGLTATGKTMREAARTRNPAVPGHLVSLHSGERPRAARSSREIHPAARNGISFLITRARDSPPIPFHPPGSRPGPRRGVCISYPRSNSTPGYCPRVGAVCRLESRVFG